MMRGRFLVLIVAFTLPVEAAAALSAPAVAIVVDPVGTVRGYENARQEQLVKEAFTLLDTALDDPVFSRRMLAATFTSRRLRLADGTVENPDNQEILRIIQTGKERQTTPDQKMTLNVRLAALRKGTVGSTKLGSKGDINTAYWFVDRCVEGNDAISMAGHLAHEWMHKAGFTHYPNNSARGDVPYVVGKLVRDILREKKIKENLAKGITETTFDNLPGYLLDEAEDEVLE